MKSLMTVCILLSCCWQCSFCLFVKLLCSWNVMWIWVLITSVIWWKSCLLQWKLEMCGKAQHDLPILCCCCHMVNMIEWSGNLHLCTLRRLLNSSREDGRNYCLVQIQQQHKKSAEVAISNSGCTVLVPIADAEWMKSVCIVATGVGLLSTTTRGYDNWSTQIAGYWENHGPHNCGHISWIAETGKAIWECGVTWWIRLNGLTCFNLRYDIRTKILLTSHLLFQCND